VYGRTLVSTVAALLLLAATAAGQGERAELAIPFKAATVSTPTGLDMDLRYLNPQDRDDKPPTIRKLAIHLPEGTRIDPTAVPVCDASNEEIQARGRDACPRETHVGTGKLDVYLGGPGDPQTTDLVLFNGPSQIVEVLLFEGTNNVAAIERLKVEGTTISGEPVQVPPGAPPDRRFSASRIVWDIPANGRYIVTPPTCPPDGLWRTAGEFDFADGSTATAQFAQPCTAAADAPRPSAAARGFSISASPRTVRLGRSTRIRVRITSGDPQCARGATIRVGTRSARTDADGNATLVALVRYLRRPLLRIATACGTTRLPLRARRP
jgi:hypothetical protein